MERILKSDGGFTFIEMMVAMVIASFVFAGIYGVYTIQQRSYTVQEQVSEMQQRLRAAVGFMTGEMRMAGYDPPNEYPDPNPYDSGVCDDASILTASANLLSFEFCRVSDVKDTDGAFKTPREYTSVVINPTYSVDYDYKIKGEDPCNLLVQRGTGTAIPLAEGIEAVEFLYLAQDGETPVTDPADTRTIKISILARSTYPDRKYVDTTVYVPASARPPFTSTAIWDINGGGAGTGNPPSSDPDGCDDPDDRCHYHRRLLITTIKLRNMGLEK